ncbi:MAG: hypothetical protein H6733_16690 [Alphaproteobacteria bacterium]|nr:hypothetical protein [Alphaproteobacteria bacterium]
MRPSSSTAVFLALVLAGCAAGGDPATDPLGVAAMPGQAGPPGGVQVLGVRTDFDRLDDPTLTPPTGGLRPHRLDRVAPTLTVTSPGRGTWGGALASVVGTAIDVRSPAVDVDIDGVAVLHGQGAFSRNVSLDVGVNVIETTAVDVAGNVATDVRSVMSGASLTAGAALDDGMVVRLNDGPQGLDGFSALASGLVAASDLSALIPNPVVNELSETCVWGLCVTWYAVRVNVTNPTLGPLTLDLDPRADGTIVATFVVNDPALDWSGTATVAEIDFSGSGDITADDITVTMVLQPSISGGVVNVNLLSTSVVAHGFDFGFTSWLEDALDFFGVDLDAIVRGYTEDAIRNAVVSEVPGVLAGVFNDLALDLAFDVGDVTLDLHAAPGSLVVDDAGLTLGLRTTVSSPQYQPMPYGSLYAGYAPVVAPTGGSGAYIELSLDFANQVLHTLWGAGLLDLDTAPDTLGVDPFLLQALFPLVTNQSLVTEAYLPPVLVPGDDADLELQVGSLRLDLVGDAVIGGGSVTALSAYTAARAPVDVAASGTDLIPTLLDPTVWVDVVAPPPSDPAAAPLEAVLTELAPALLPTLTDVLGAITLPSIEGFTITNASVREENGYLVIGGSLVQAP